MITVTTEGRPWDDPSAAWTPTTHGPVADPLVALQMISAADAAENTRPASWRADSEAEAETLRAMLSRRPRLAYVVDMEQRRA